MALTGDLLTISINGDVQLQRRVKETVWRVTDAEPVWRAIMDYLTGVEQRQFNSDGKASSGGWQQLAESTIAEKTAEGMPHPDRPLHGWGDLEDSLTRRGEGGGAVRIIEQLYMIFGTQIEYAKYHQGNEVRTRIPLRRFLELTEYQRKTIAKWYQQFVVTGKTTSPRVKSS